jgi:hypothetical protein
MNRPYRFFVLTYLRSAITKLLNKIKLFVGLFLLFHIKD